MLDDILLAFWFLLPAAVANGAPILAARFPLVNKWDARMDFGKKFHGKPLLGSHKTWRGLISGVLSATLLLWLQQQLFINFEWTEMFTAGINYAALPVLILGPLFGLGALGGDALESFFKRRRGTKSGDTWIPFDQIDYIIGATLASLPFVILSLRQYLFVFIIWFAMHILSTYIGWRLGLKAKPI